MLFDSTEIGASVSFENLGHSGRLDALLFGESQGRVLIAVRPEDTEGVIQKAADISLPAVLLGKTENSDQLKISVSGDLILNTKVSGLKNAWESAIPKHMQTA